MQTIPLAKICPIKTNFEQLISDEPPHSYIRTPYFGIGIMRNLQMAMQLCISILFIDKWLCNFTFRFCSSTNGYATLHFDFVHRQMAMQLYISVLFINKWLCNFTFRFCSSTKWLCNFTFRFCSSTKWLCNFAFRFCSSTKWLSNFAIQLCRRACIISTWKTVMSENKMEFPHGKWTMSMNKMEFPHGKWAMSMNKFEFPHGNALCRFCVLPLSIAIAIFLSIPHKYYLCTREIFMIDVKKQSIFP